MCSTAIKHQAGAERMGLVPPGDPASVPPLLLCKNKEKSSQAAVVCMLQKVCELQERKMTEQKPQSEAVSYNCATVQHRSLCSK